MKSICLFLSLILIQLSSFSQNNQDVFKEIDTYVSRTSVYMGNCPYAIVISKNGNVLYEKYSKGAGVLGEINENSRWLVFSITKSFISALTLTLVEKNQIKLDDHVSMYLPAFQTKGNGAFDRRDVTIRNLMSHTSGAAVNGQKLPASNPSDLNDVDIITQPGKDFLYSGLGMNILERTLEAATGKDLDVLLQENVIKPLGLKSASYIYSENDPNGKVLPLRPDKYTFSKKGDRAGSGLFINARDLNKFGQFWLNPEKLFSKKLRDEAWKWHGTRDLDGGDYGLLWWLFADQGAYVMSGLQYKVNVVIPQKGLVITVLRLPQNDETFEFWPDKFKLVTFGNRIK
ncbi:MAG: serine hydrolase domain-containing protein [Bacteroidota bacterium]